MVEINEHADTDPTPTTAEGQAWLDAVQADAADGSLWAVPSIREQLSEAYERTGLSDSLPEAPSEQEEPSMDALGRLAQRLHENPPSQTLTTEEFLAKYPTRPTPPTA